MDIPVPTIPEMIIIVGAITQWVKGKFRPNKLKSVLFSMFISVGVMVYCYLKKIGAVPELITFTEIFVGANVTYQVIKSKKANLNT